ncbi:hypothetical protein, partial [Vogesella indigofera]|uniref:hypothetical protein n=1 Tax=Vogesella indigofera TaxID=45465 RepID=UPI00234F862D
NRFALEGLRKSTSGLGHEHCSLVAIIHLKLVSTGSGTDHQVYRFLQGKDEVLPGDSEAEQSVCA